MAITNLTNYRPDSEYLYMLLARLAQDCEYFLNNGNRNKKWLWALEANEHLHEMEEIYNYLNPKPEWLTVEDIERYKELMCC